MAISTRCGGKDRLYRNTLLFLAGTSRGLAKLRQAHRERAALEGVRTDYWDQLDEEQREDLKKRLEAARKAALEAVGAAYSVVLRVRGQEVESCVLSDAPRTFQEHLGYVWTTLVEDEEWILRRVGLVTLESTGLIPKEGGLRLKDAVEAFLRFTDKPMVATKQAVTKGLEQACAEGKVGIGRGPSLQTLQARYCKQSVSLDPSEDGVWIIPPFAPEPPNVPGIGMTPGAGVGAGEPGAAGGTPITVVSGGDDQQVSAGQPSGTGGTSVGTPPGGTSGTATATKPEAKRMIRRLIVQGQVPAENWGDLFRCFVGPAFKMNLKQLSLGVQFEMVARDDEPLSENDSTFKAMKEAARQLGLKLDIEG
jgi:hypothetical protein